MNQRSRSALLVLALTIGAAATAHFLRPTQYLAAQTKQPQLAQLFPVQFNEWRVDESAPVQLVSPDQQALLNKLYSQVLNRTYVNADGDRIMLSVAYGGDQSDGSRAHRPDVCYPAQGFDILSKSRSTFDFGDAQLPVLQMVARQGSRTEPVSYWFVVGGFVALSSTEQKLAQLRYGFRGYIPDGMLIRVSSIDPSSSRAFAQQRAFVKNMRDAIPAAQRAMVFGASSAALPALRMSVAEPLPPPAH